MSNFIDLAMQNSQAEQSRKRRKKSDIEDALMSGGSSGSSDSSNLDSSDSSSSSIVDYSNKMNDISSSSASFGQYINNMVKDVASDIIMDKAIDVAKDKAGDFIKKHGDDILEKVGQKIGHEVLEEGLEAGIKWGSKALKFGGKAIPYLNAALWAKDGMDAVAYATTGKDMDGLLSEDIDMDIDKERDDMYQRAIDEGMSERDAINLSYQAYAGVQQAQDFRDLYQGIKGMFSKNKEEKEEEKKKKEEEEKKKKEIEEAEKKKREAEEKIKKDNEAKKATKQSEEDDEEDEDDEDENADSNNASNTALKRGLRSGLLHTAGTLGGSACISFALIGTYRVHYMGEFEYKGISAEYQSSNKDYQNFTSYDEDGNVILEGLSKENKLMKTFYTKYSDKSYYAIVEDTKKYSNIDDAYKRENLLTPDELREQYPDIEDVNNREVMFQLNPDVLYALDKYIHNDSVLYPQQFVKPVYYDESQKNFGLKDLVDGSGRILAKSQEFDSNGKPLKNSDGSFKTTEGIWDYGFASILRYKEEEVKRRQVTNPVKRDVKLVSEGVKSAEGKVEAEVLESGVIPGVDTVVKNIANREKPAYIIDTAVTPGGTITNKIEKQWIKNPESSSSSTDTFRFSVKVGEEPGYCPIPPEADTDNGSFTPLSLRATNSQVPEGMYVCGSIPIYDVYEVTDHYETYIEENLPQYVGEPSTETITGSKYFRDYMSSYSNYFPSKLPTRLDFRVLDNDEVKSLIFDDNVSTDTSMVEGSGEESEETEASARTQEDINERVARVYQARTIDAATSANDLSTLLGIGSQKDSALIKRAMQYYQYYEKYGNMYGVDPFILIAMTCQESGANPNSSGAARGLMQIEHTVKKVTAYNHETKQVETVQVVWDNLFNPDYNIKIGAMQLADRLDDYKYNILMSLQGYNFGPAGIGSAVQYYLSNGTIGINHTVDYNAVYAYAETNDTGWITTTYPGDLPKERESAWGKNPNDGKHEARTWYSDTGWRKYNQGGGDCGYLEKVLRYYAGPSQPWVMKPDGTVIALDGSATVGSYSGGSTPSQLFNTYLSSNWDAILDKWDLLFPGQKELDESLDLVKKGDYTALYNNYEEKARYISEPGLKTRASVVTTLPRNNNIYTPSMTEIDKQLTLNMMFALNQSNYLFKYDNMTEMEWKAMYTQLLSSPTGTTWDDKWIGFTKKDIFGVDEIGTLFREDAGISPVISVPYGTAKNNYSEDTTMLTKYNYTNFGIDVVVPPETEVLTVADGEVLAISKKDDVSSRYGNYVEIQHVNGTQTITANLKEVKVKVGDKLKMGDVIGTSGGNCKSYKDNAIHYQIRHKGQLINPTWVITGDMTGFEDPILGNNGVVCGGTVQVSNNPVVNKAISVAREQVGKPYVWGATGPNSFDCSGFMYYIMKQAGIQEGRRTALGYYNESTQVSRDQIQPGDFVFWHDLTGNKHSPVYHVGMYVGNGEVIDCSTDHGGVGTRNLDDLQDSAKRRFTFGRYAPFAGSGSGVTSSGCMAPGAAVSSDFIWPVPSSSTISSPFGMRIHPVDGVKKMHSGIDISAPEGTDIVAAKAGVVEVSEYQSGYGNVIYIKHDDGSQTRYAHNTKNLVKVGDVVTQGQHIADMGSTGKSTGSHLHFEIRIDGEAKNPSDYVKP